MTAMTTKQKAGYPLRMPGRLRESLEHSARESGRSLHAEIIHRLEEYSWIEAESAERREIADHVMREKVELLEELSDKSAQLHEARAEIIKLKETLQASGYPSNKLIGLEYERMKKELRQELQAELVGVAREAAREALLIAATEKDE